MRLDRWITLAEARADWPGVSVEKLLTWMANGIFPAPELPGGKVRWSSWALDGWYAAGMPRQPRPTDEYMDRIMVGLTQERRAAQKEV